MPITADILKHETLGPRLKAWYKEAEQRGREEGRQSKINLLQRMLEKRFGPLPAWAREKLAFLPVSKLEDLGDRLLDARSLDDLLRRRAVKRR